MLSKLLDRWTDADYKEILSKGFSFLLFRVGGLFAGYLFTFIVARNFGASVNGLVAIGFSLFLFVSIFGCFGIDINIVKYYSRKLNIEKNIGVFYKVLTIAIVVSTILAFILYSNKEYVSETLFKKPQLMPYIKWISFAIPFWVITLICAGYLRAKKFNNWFAFLNNPGRFLFTLVVLITLLNSTNNPTSILEAHFYGVLLLAILSLFVVIKSLGRITFRAVDNSLEFLKDSFPMMLSSTALVLLGWLDTFILGIYEPDDVVGIYNVSIKIAMLTIFSLQAINSILAPKLASYYAENNMEGVEKLIDFSTKLNLILTLLTVIGIVVFHKTLLGLFGTEFVQGTPVLIIICCGQLLSSLSGSVGVIMQMTGNQKDYQNIILIALAVNLILNFALIPSFGDIGAAVSTVISLAVWKIIGVVYLKRKLKLTTYFTYR